ncbi:MAG: OsmC family protein [Actinomycetota bacterium]
MELETSVAAGTLRPAEGVVFPHRWTEEGVTVTSEFTGGHLYLLAAAGCVLNDLYREAGPLGIDVRGVRVRAVGGLDTETWVSTGIEYSVEVDADATREELDRLLDQVDAVAEIPKALRVGTTVTRRDGPTRSP